MIIDSFSTAETAVSDTTANAAGVGAEQTTADAIGGYRDVFVNKDAGVGSTAISFFIDGSGIGFHIEDPTVAGFLVLTWDGTDGAPTSGGDVATGGLGSVDLTDSDTLNGILLKIVSADQAFTLTFRVWSDGGADFSDLVVAAPAGFGGYDLPLFFASFVGTADFHDVSALQMRIDGPTSQDIVIDFIEARQIPEPLTLGAIGLGLLAALTFRSRRRAKTGPAA